MRRLNFSSDAPSLRQEGYPKRPFAAEANGQPYRGDRAN